MGNHPSIADLVPEGNTADGFAMRAYRGKVFRAPATVDERLLVTVDGFDTGPWRAAWIPRPNPENIDVPTAGSVAGESIPGTITGTVSGSSVSGTSSSSSAGGPVTFTTFQPAAKPLVLPAEDDPCLIVFDNAGDAWAWVWPYA